MSIQVRGRSTHSLIPIRSSRRAVNGHQYLLTTADQSVPMITVKDLWNAMVVTSISLSLVLYLFVSSTIMLTKAYAYKQVKFYMSARSMRGWKLT